jgi:hypothetical protein
MFTRHEQLKPNYDVVIIGGGGQDLSQDFDLNLFPSAGEAQRRPKERHLWSSGSRVPESRHCCDRSAFSFAHYFWTTLLEVGRGVGALVIGSNT